MRLLPGLLTIVGCTLLLGFIYDRNFSNSLIGPFEQVSWVAAVLGFLLMLPGALQLRSARRRAAERVSTPEQLDRAEVALRSAVRAYALHELRRRGLDGRLMALRWRLDDKRVESPFTPDGTASRLLHAPRLVIVAEQGAGKTTLALLLCKALADPVPVLVPATSWRATYGDLTEWITAWIKDNVLELGNVTEYGGTAVLGLVSAHRVTCVIDGLDEIPEDDRVALLRLIREAGAEASFVLTCRKGPYRHLRKHIQRVRSSHAVELLPISPEDAIAYLAEDDPRWRSVRTEPLAALLSNPLMVYLLSRTYFTESTADAKRMWRALVPSVLRDSADQLARRQPNLLVPWTGARTGWPPERAERWFRTLARDLSSETGELRWWEFVDRYRKVKLLFLFISLLLSPASYLAASLLLNHTVDWSAVRNVLALALVIQPGLFLFPNPFVGKLESWRSRRPELDSVVGIAYASGVVVAVGVSTNRDLVSGIVSGVLVGWVVLLAATAAIARRPVRPRGPVSALRTARRHAWITTVVAWTGVAALVGALPPAMPSDELFNGAAVAPGFALSWLSTTGWGGYLAVRLFLAIRGRLPWRLTRFLEDASRLGLIQRVGTHYAFRHSRLRTALATTAGSSEADRVVGAV